MRIYKYFRLLLLFFLASQFLVLEPIMLSSLELHAQVRYRRKKKTTTPGNTRKKETSTTSDQKVSELEKRNKQLLEQIINLQNERDFYKKKLLEWSELQQSSKETTTSKEKTPSVSPVKRPSAVSTRVDTVYVKTAPETIYVAPRKKGGLNRTDSLVIAIQRLLASHQFLTARGNVEKLLTETDLQDKHYYLAGMVYFGLGDYNQAIVQFQKVVFQDSLKSLATYFAGRAYLESGLTRMAGLKFQQCRQLKNGEILSKLGLAFLKCYSDTSIPAVDYLLSIQSPWGEIQSEKLYLLSLLEERNNNLDRALAFLQQAVASSSADLKKVYHLAELYFQKGFYPSASKLFQITYDNNFSKKESLKFLLMSDYYRRNLEAALHWAKVLQVEDSDREFLKKWLPKVYYLCSLTAASNGDYQSANRFYLKALRLEPNASNWMKAVLSDLAIIHQQNQDYLNAIKHYHELSRLSTDDGRIYLELGKLYLQTGDYQNATIFLSKARNFKELKLEALTYLDEIRELYSNP